MQPIKKRLDGEEQPYIGLFNGLFKVRLPFVHWEWEFPEMVQAMLSGFIGSPLSFVKT